MAQVKFIRLRHGCCGLAFAITCVALTLGQTTNPAEHANIEARLRQVFGAVATYTDNSRGWYPPYLGHTIPFVKKGSPWFSGGIAPERYAAASAAEKAVIINQETDIRFTRAGAKLGGGGVPRNMPLLVKRVESTGELAICFADGHIEWFVPRPTAATTRPDGAGSAISP